jgi:isoleucyl-tRNA synthetase
MNGRKVIPYIAGWDCHGLPVEIEVERLLGLTSKKDIETFGVAKFNAMCRESVVKYEADWEHMSQRIGYWIDYDNAYMTMSNDYIESVWWSLKQLHSKGLLARGYQVLPYCPRCETTLSTHEVALGFKEAEGRVVVIKLRLEGMDASLLVYSSDPWTLVGNALLAIDRDREYVEVEHAGERLILAADRREAMIPVAKEVSRFPGSELIGRKYGPPFNYFNHEDNAFVVVHSSEVPKDDGTGIIPVAPAYGSLDYELGKREGVGLFDPVDSSGRFTDKAPDLEGRLARDSDAEVMRLLDAKGLLLKWGLLRRSYPFCWRCDSALIYKPTESWFVKASLLKKRMIELNEQVKWVPETFKEGRFGSFLVDARDWAISRTRYWGTPLPVWRCKKGHEVCVGSLEELRRLAATEIPDKLDLHRPFIDDIELECGECGGTMRRERFVIDCWYDSGCAPFAQYHYPFENMEQFDTHRSVDFISESVDQTRGWFYTQHVISTALFDKPAFKSVLVMGTVLDKEGKKMRKDSGNEIYPDDVFAAVGADASRLYLLGSPVWQSVEFSQESVRETMVGTMNTLLNIYSFYSSNANAYGYGGEEGRGRTHDLDRWLISRLNSMVVDTRSAFDTLEVHRAVTSIRSFVEDMSNWYVRRSRRRFWEDSDPQDRFSAHVTLKECLLTLSMAMAPIAPFFADWLYRNMKGSKESVHLDDYPIADTEAINQSLESQMELVRGAVEAGRLARQKEDLKLRQPLDEVVIAAGHDDMWVLRRYEKMIAEELNVKKVEVLESREKMIDYAVSPNLKNLGPRLKEGAPEVARLMSMVDGSQLVTHLKTKGKIRLGGFDLFEDDVIVTEKEKAGYSHANVGGVHAYVSIGINQKLKLEGLAREVVRRIQHMRKQQGLRFEDSVVVEYSGHPDVEMAISSHKSHIIHETHASNVVKKAELDNPTKWTVNKLNLELVVRKA